MSTVVQQQDAALTSAALDAPPLRYVVQSRRGAPVISGMTMPEWVAPLARGDYLAALRSLRASLDDTQPLAFDMLIYVLQAVGSFSEADEFQARRSELERSLGAEVLPSAIREVLASLADIERQPDPLDVGVIDAPRVLEQAVREHRITILCEEHPHPEHRVLGARMLPRLRQAGVTHLALETGMQGPLDDARHSKRVTPTTDGFSFEPQRAGLLRVAFQEGLQAVAFDMDGHDFEWVQAHPDELVSYRERRMAEHIVERILQPEPTARVLVWVGHGHGQKGRRFKMMAQYLWDLVGTEPFSVYQLTGDGRRPGVDAVVRHPMPTYENGRPDWLRQDGRVSVTGSISAPGMHLVQLHLASEGDGGTPVDQMVTREGKIELLVPPDEYLLRIWGPDEQLMQSRSLRVTPTGLDLQFLND